MLVEICPETDIKWGIHQTLKGHSLHFASLKGRLVTAMFAVIGKNLYDKNHPESFRDFAHAMFTMYQVATGDSWASGVARPIIFQNDLTSKKFSIDGVAMV